MLKIIHTMGHGGAENIFRWLAWNLKGNGVDVVAGIPLHNDPVRRENWIEPALKELEVNYEMFDKTGGSIQLLKNIVFLIKKVRPDIVHSHLLDSNFYSSVACRWLSIPHVCTEHGDIALKGTFSARTKFRILSRLTDSLVCVSCAVRNSVTDIGVDTRKLGVIYNGIVVRDQGETHFRKEMQIGKNSLLIGSVGNLYPVKGQRYLIEAFSRFITVFPDSYLVLVGRGGERQRLERAGTRLGIPRERLIFTGFRNDVSNIIRAIDIYVQPSLSEGLPVALLEAMFFGIPVIATDVGGVSEIFGSDKYSLLVPAESWEKIYETLLRVAGDIELFKENAENLKKKVREQHSLHNMTAQYVELYKEVLARRGGRRCSCKG